MRVRVGVDLNNDQWIEWGDTPTNLLSSPLAFHANPIVLLNAAVDYGLEKEVTNFGIYKYHVGFTAPNDALRLETQALLNATAYTAVVWVRAKTANSETVTLHVRDDANGAIANSGAVNVGEDWTALRVPFTTVNSSFIYIRLDCTTSVVDVEYEVTGYGLYAGTQNTAIYNGGGDPEENITSFVLSFVTQIGANNRLTALTAQDGTATIVLDNVDQEFTPRNDDSPYFETLLRYRLVRIEVDPNEDGNWTPLFTGFVDKLQLDAGSAGSRQATIECVQGMMNLEDKYIETEPAYDTRADEVIPDLVSEGRLAAERYAWQLNVSLWGVNTFIAGDETTMRVDGGSYTYPIANAGLGENATVRSSLDEYTINEQGMAWVDRHGRFNWRNRELFLDGDNTLGDVPDLNADTEVQYADYQYRDIQATTVRIGYTPRVAIEGIIWDSGDEPIKLKPLEELTLEVNPETSEGYRIIPLALDQSSESALSTSITVTNGLASKIKCSLSVVGDKIRVKLISTDNNTDHDPAELVVAVYGAGFYELKEQVAVVKDDDLLAQNSARVIEQTVSLSMISENVEASAIAVRVLENLTATRDGIFDVRAEFGPSLSWTEQDRLEFLLGLSVGSTVNISESHSMLPAIPHIIVNEEIRFSAVGTTVQYSLIPLQLVEDGAWVLDKSEWGVNTVLRYE